MKYFDEDNYIASWYRRVDREYPQTIPTMRFLWPKTAFLAIILLVSGCTEAFALNGLKYAITDQKAILSIIGEGENQGYTGMLALAGAIRNRGTLQGVYGLNAPRVIKRKYSVDTYRTAQKAWAQSAGKDITNGATHWENINSFGKPYWAYEMDETFRYKDHVFYKERRNYAKHL